MFGPIEEKKQLFQSPLGKVRKGDLKRVEIVEAAIQCFATIGYEKTTYEAIASKMGTRRAHVAYYFPEKDDILKASVQHIMNVYLGILSEQLTSEKTASKRFRAYVRSPFRWAKKYPHQLSAMLLFYYQCRIRPEFRKLHNDIRASGLQRIHFMLTSEIGLKISNEKGLFLAKSIQNIMSGYLLDAATTSSVDIDEAENKATTMINMLVDDYI